MEGLDYSTLSGRIIRSEEFKKLQGKESPVQGYIDADFFVRAVADYAGRIASEINFQQKDINTKKLVIDREYCELLAYIKYLGMPAYGREGKIAFDETIGKTYSQSDINIKLAERKLRIQLPEEMKDDIRQLEYEDINDVTSNAARTVLIAQNMIEDMKLLTDEETKKLGGIILTNTLIEECSLDEKGRIIPGEVYNKITPVLQQKRRKPINRTKIEKAKENLENNLIEGIIEKPIKNREESVK